VLSAEVVQNAERGRNDGGSLTPEKNGEAAGLLQTGAILKGTWHSVQGCAHAGVAAVGEIGARVARVQSPHPADRQALTNDARGPNIL
jgi:hypothetical protein